MESIVKYDSKPILKDPILIEALPGIGNVGKIAGDFIADTLKATKFATILSMNFPPTVIPDKDCVFHMACNELWYAKTPAGQDIVFLKGNFQGSTPEGQFVLAQDILEIMQSYGVSRVITLGGLGVGNMLTEDPRVFGTISRLELRDELEPLGILFNPGEPQAGVIGAAGALIGFAQMYGIDSFCLMGETPGFFADYKSAKMIIDILAKMFSIEEMDTEEIEKNIKSIDELTGKIDTATKTNSDEDLSYIG